MWSTQVATTVHTMLFKVTAATFFIRGGIIIVHMKAELQRCIARLNVPDLLS